MAEAARAFNQPTSLAGRLAFRFLGWLEGRIRTASRVGATPFFDEALFPWADAVKSQWLAVQREAMFVMSDRADLPAFQDISPEVGYITTDQQWKTFMLLGYGLPPAANQAQCAATMALLRRIPGKRLPPLRGPYNGVLRLHLGLIVPHPEERCWIRVGSERRHWRPGELLIFDDALEHEVHNDTAGVRVVLFVDFVRPCRLPISVLNRAVIFAARFSPLVRRARDNQRRWEAQFYGAGDRVACAGRVAADADGVRDARLERPAGRWRSHGLLRLLVPASQQRRRAFRGAGVLRWRHPLGRHGLRGAREAAWHRGEHPWHAAPVAG